MIKDNRIIAGYGTLAVDSLGGSNRLVIRHIQPPQEIGSDLLKNIEKIEILKTISISIDFNGYFELKHFLEEVSVERPVFTFKNWIFDFSKFNAKSVEVFKKGLENAFSTLPFAC